METIERRSEDEVARNEAVDVNPESTPFTNHGHEDAAPAVSGPASSQEQRAADDHFAAVNRPERLQASIQRRFVNPYFCPDSNAGLTRLVFNTRCVAQRSPSWGF